MTASELTELRALLRQGKPFSACILPGEEALRFNCIEVSPWPGSQINDTPAETVQKTEYLAEAEDAIKTLKERPKGYKTVLARTISGNFSKFDPEGMAAEYFPQFPDCLRFIIYSPQYGYWMGATPELLLVKDINGVRTRALAGTRPAGTPGEWSVKNREEHLIVLQDIKQYLGDAALVHDTKVLTYGTVEHLCTEITVPAEAGIDADSVAKLLHPTPAVGGFPREWALNEIQRLEMTPRKLYGGMMRISLPERKLFYVMLRCVHFNRERWCVYTGSGLTASSEPEDEWQETSQKAAPLLQILRKY